MKRDWPQAQGQGMGSVKMLQIASGWGEGAQ